MSQAETDFDPATGNYVFKREKMKRLMLVIGLVAVLFAACATADPGSVALAPKSALPGEILQAPESVQEAYRYALANPDVLSQIPCYCGCGAMGHASNLACYISETAPDGTITFDYHAFG